MLPCISQEVSAFNLGNTNDMNVQKWLFVTKSLVKNILNPSSLKLSRKALKKSLSLTFLMLYKLKTTTYKVQLTGL